VGNLRTPKQTSPVNDYPVESRSQIATQEGIHQRRFSSFFFSFDGTTSLIKDLGLIGSCRGGCPKRQKAVDQAGRKRSAQGEKRDEPWPTKTFDLKPPGNRIQKFSPTGGLSSS